MSPTERLNVLIVEDNPADAELEVRALERGGLKIDSRRVETEADYVAALKPGLDLILSDLRLPQFDGMSALRLLKEAGADIPFILVSGAVGEEKAVEAMLHGAFAYVMKSRLVSLAPIVSRALSETALRRGNIEANERLKKSEKRYRRLFESSQDGLLVLDAATGAVLDVNPSLLALIGYQPAELLGRKLGELSAFQGLEALERDLRTIPLVRRDDLTLTAKDGRRVDVEFVGGVDNDAKVIQCSVRDVTERKRLQAQFLQAQKMESIGLLAGGVAHDFNNILMTIMACASFLRESLAKEDPRRADVLEIETAAARAAALTRQLLIFSRKQTVSPVVLDLNELVGNFQKMLRRLIGEDIELAVQLSPEPALVLADPGQLEQVIMNLSVNAREAMPKGGRLALKTEVLKEGAGWVRLEVADTGCGMTPEVLARIFEPFFTTRPAGKGTGLGLATVYGVVTQAGGAIDVRSAPGRGTTFDIRLPMSAAAAPRKESGEAAAAARGRETILIVDDEEALRRSSVRALEAQGYRVLSAGRGEEALELLKGRGDVSLLLTDVVMPGMGGGELAQKAVRLLPKLKVIFMTGYIADDQLSRIEAQGGEIVRKPAPPEALARRVREVLDRS